MSEADGSVLWSHDTAMDGEPAQFHGEIRLTDRLVLVGSDVEPEHDGFLYAFDQATGSVQWQRAFPGGVPADVLGRDGRIFVVETLSVAIQVAYFKMTGRRVFLMAPIHHHFEQLGWPEQKIVVRFWIISAILGLVALSSLKLR